MVVDVVLVVVLEIVVVVVVVDVVDLSGVGVVVEVNEGGLGNKEFDFITVGGCGPDADTSRTPPQVRTHSSPERKLFPFPPQPVYRNFRQLFDKGSW